MDSEEDSIFELTKIRIFVVSNIDDKTHIHAMPLSLKI